MRGILIGDASRYVGVSTQALRVWESESLIKPWRSKSGTRYYSDEDLERLLNTWQLKETHGLKSAAIRREIGAVEDPAFERSLGERVASLIDRPTAPPTAL